MDVVSLERVDERIDGGKSEMCSYQDDALQSWDALLTKTFPSKGGSVSSKEVTMETAWMIEKE